MASRGGVLDLRGAGAFAVGIWVRAALIGALTFGAFLAASHHLYATALVAGVVGGLIGLDVARGAGAADRQLAQFVDGLIAEGDDRPIRAPGVGALATAIERALDRLAENRALSQQRADFTAALADNVLAALLVVDDVGDVILANRAARTMLGETDGPLGRLANLPPDSLDTLIALAPGGRAIMRLADNRALLASGTGFSVPGRGPLRLIALQTLSGDLDVVVLKAWQDLARVLAHEMMNSLTPISSLSESLAGRLRGTGSLEPAEMAAAVEVIARRSAGLMNFVERYRKLCDLPPAVRGPVAMAPLAARLEQLMAARMRDAAVVYANEVSPPNLSVEADLDLLEQALINLLKNAIEAVSGRPGARVRLLARSEAGGVSISVEDNGPGLADEDPEAAFTPFFTTKPGGAGVGLSLARQIALAHGGRLDYARRAGGGASFTILLPTAGQDRRSGER
jgi:nitrogen fixation/metabolism regulation signal transduction histidine kinase